MKLVSALVYAAAVLFVAFAVAVIVEPDTQLLAILLGGAFALLAAALLITAKRIVPREIDSEPRKHLEDRFARQEIREKLQFPRRRLIAVAAAALGAAVAAPLTALGPAVGDSIETTPWRRGRRLVDEDGKPLTVDDVAPGSFVTAFPEGADKRELGSPVVLVREQRLELPPERRDWAPEGILAFSKICTHAGCAISLYRTPAYEPTSARPALACPCHYSVFDTRRGGTVTSGPAGRPLPQLPLMVGPGGELHAAGGFSGPIGPAWWSARG